MLIWCAGPRYGRRWSGCLENGSASAVKPELELWLMPWAMSFMAALLTVYMEVDA
jgi:hypothetical protein